MAEQPRRAEELIAEVWRQRSELVRAGSRPRQVVLSPANYRIIQEYRARLGTLDNKDADYLREYELFDLEIHVDHAYEIQVE